MVHLKESKSRFVYLKGSPGTSKTAISKSIATQLSEENRLAASFFFDKSRANEGTNCIKKFASTLAFQLAQALPMYKLRMHKLITSAPAVLQRPPEDQLRLMITEPMNAVVAIPLALPLVIILDGLDECGDSNDLSALMRLVVQLNDLPSNITILVSCRPEDEIEGAWEQLEHPPITLDTNKDPQETEKAIREYVQYHINELLLSKRAYRNQDSWRPTPEEVDEFAKQCGGIFGIASIRILRLREGLRRYLPGVFDGLLKEGRARRPTYKTEYLGVLQRALRGNDGSYSDSKADIVLYRKVIGFYLATDRSITVGSLALLAGEDQLQVRCLLAQLSSVIQIGNSQISEDDTKLTCSVDSDQISFRHATFPEFLLGTPEGTAEEKKSLFFTRHEARLTTSECSLQYMRKDSALGSTCSIHEVLYPNPPHLYPSLEILYPTPLSGVQVISIESCHSEPSTTATVAQRDRANALWDACFFWSENFYPEHASPKVWEALSTFVIRDSLRWIEFLVVTTEPENNYHDDRLNYALSPLIHVSSLSTLDRYFYPDRNPLR